MLDFKEKANLIWKVADLLRGDYKRSDYGKVILPMTVLRRLDCVLSPPASAKLPKTPSQPHAGAMFQHRDILFL
jgi:type I restriction enzyme M protein